jgi:hypothetical protein
MCTHSAALSHQLLYNSQPESKPLLHPLIQVKFCCCYTTSTPITNQWFVQPDTTSLK